MTIYRMTDGMHIFNIASIGFCSSTLLLSKLGIETVIAIPIMLILFACFNFINMMLTRYIIDETSMVYKTMISKTEIRWDEAECIAELQLVE